MLKAWKYDKEQRVLENIRKYETFLQSSALPLCKKKFQLLLGGLIAIFKCGSYYAFNGLKNPVSRYK